MTMRPKVAKRLISQKIQELVQSGPSEMGLPSNIFTVALAGYSTRNLSFSEVTLRRNELAKLLRQTVPSALIQTGSRRSLNPRRRAAAVMIYHPRTAPTRGTTFFGAYCETFLVCEWRLAFLHTMEPVATTAHLHQRMLERSQSVFKSFAELQDDLSTIWPALIELGNLRRMQGEKANLTCFFSPWEDGLMFGDFMAVPGMALAAPRVIEFRDGGGVEMYLHDFYAKGNQRALALIRTFIGPREMRAHQAQLKKSLDEFVACYRDVLRYLKLKPRLGLDLIDYDPDRPSDAYPDVFAHVLGAVRPTGSRISRAIQILDRITKSDEWRRESEVSERNRRSQSF